MTSHNFVRLKNRWRCDICQQTWRSRPYSSCPGSPTAQRQQALYQARLLLQRSDIVVLDTETTGLGKRDQIIEIAMLSLQGDILAHEVVCPSKDVFPPKYAPTVSKWDDARLQEKPAFPAVYAHIAAQLHNRVVLAYNARFDERMLRQTCTAYGLPMPQIQAWKDALPLYKLYAAASTSLKLPSAAHRAVDDCIALLDLLYLMAEIPPPPFTLAPAPSPPILLNISPPAPEVAPPLLQDAPAEAISLLPPQPPPPPSPAAPLPQRTVGKASAPSILPIQTTLPERQRPRSSPPTHVALNPHYPPAPPRSTLTLGMTLRSLWGALIGLPICLAVETWAHGWSWLLRPEIWLIVGMLAILGGLLWLDQCLSEGMGSAIPIEGALAAGRIFSWFMISAALLAVTVRLIAVTGGPHSAPGGAADLAPTRTPAPFGATAAWPTTSPAPPPTPAWCGPVAVIDGPLNVRQSPTQSGQRVGQLESGQLVRYQCDLAVFADDYGWVRIESIAEPMLAGYVATAYLDLPQVEGRP